MSEFASLKLRTMGSITESFFVARYQRGYRWTPHEVKRLLDDLWEHHDGTYSLQPVVVKERRERSEWELIDGQQRLTTIFLLYTYLKRTGLKNFGPRYSLRYETRPGSETWLEQPDADASVAGRDIDWFHIHQAWTCIARWFESVDDFERQHRADKLFMALYERVHVLWYQAPDHLDATALFRRLNVGRIPLTDAELVKAQLLSQLDDRDRRYRATELSAQWDRIERDLRDPEIWAFLTPAAPDAYPTRITLLLDALADRVAPAPRGRRPRFHTFETLRGRLEQVGGQASLWDDLVDLHGQLLGWYEDRHLYHRIGFLTATGDPFESLATLGQGATRSAFVSALDARIRRRLNLPENRLPELTYSQHDERCRQVLLLMNVETIRRLDDSTERYPFRRHSRGNMGVSWTLEHIHAQQAESLTKAAQWAAWLDEHLLALRDLPTERLEDKEALAAELEALRQPDGTWDIDGGRFQELFQQVAALFSSADHAEDDPVDAVTNLALLPQAANSALSNAVFEVKRRRILALDRKGARIPICTRRVFLKYYTEAAATQLHFWGPRDRAAYLAEMRHLLADYLLPAEDDR